MGSNSPEDSPLMKHYTDHLRREMEEVEGQQLTTPQGYQITFRMKLIPCDMKWASSMSGEVNNCTSYFSPFANVNQNTKTTMDGSVGGSNDTWQEWEYEKRIATAKKVEALKAKLRDPSGKERSKVTQLISKEKSRQEFVPPLGKFVNLIKAEPLHNTNNAWQHWFTNLLTVVMQYADDAELKSATSLSDMPDDSPVTKFLTHVRETAKCGRLYNSFVRWFGEKRKKGISFTYRFTGLESKNFSWYFNAVIQEVMSIPRLSQGSVLKLHALAFIGLKLRDAASLYSRVDITKEQVDELKTLCHDYFKANLLFLKGVNPTVWTLGYAIPHHTRKLFEELGHGLGLNSMQGREAKHVKLAMYIEYMQSEKEVQVANCIQT